MFHMESFLDHSVSRLQRLTSERVRSSNLMYELRSERTPKYGLVKV